VDSSIAKDAETRIIEPLAPNLVEWLKVIGSSCPSPLPMRNLKRRWGRAREVVGHPNPTLLRKDYNNAVTRAEAESFWSIAPGG